MSQIFDTTGKVVPVTVISASPVTVTYIKSEDKDGYNAVVFGCKSKKMDKISKPQRGAFKKHLGESAEGFSCLREWRIDNESSLKIGDKVGVSIFEKGENVTVSGVSKGKGFQGVVKRHGFAGGPRTHGQKHSERAPGSIGAGGRQRVFKDLRMAGRMGSDRVTVKNLEIVDKDEANNLIFVKGAIPGRRGTLVEIYN